MKLIQKFNKAEKIFEDTYKATNQFLLDNNFDLIKKHSYRDTYLYKNSTL